MQDRRSHARVSGPSRQDARPPRATNRRPRRAASQASLRAQTEQPRRYCLTTAAAPFLSTYFWILPVAVFGSSDTNVTPWSLEVGQSVACEGDELDFSRRCTRLQHHICEWRLSPLLVWQPDDCRLLHGGVA